MGFSTVTINIELLLSNHNSVNDDLDYVRFKWLQRDIENTLKRYWGNGDPYINQSTGERRWTIVVNDGAQGGYLLGKDSFSDG